MKEKSGEAVELLGTAQSDASLSDLNRLLPSLNVCSCLLAGVALDTRDAEYFAAGAHLSRADVPYRHFGLHVRLWDHLARVLGRPGHTRCAISSRASVCMLLERPERGEDALHVL